MLKMRNRRWCKKNSHVCHKFQFLREHQEKKKNPLPTANSCHKSYILELSWSIGRQNPISVSGKCNLWQQLQQNKNLVSGEAITATKPFSSELKLPLPFLPHAPDVQDIWKKPNFLSSSCQTLTQQGKSEMQASTWLFSIRAIWKKDSITRRSCRTLFS